MVTNWSCSKKLTSTTQAKTANKKLNDASEEIPLYVPQKDVIAPIVASKCLKQFQAPLLVSCRFHAAKPAKLNGNVFSDA